MSKLGSVALLVIIWSTYDQAFSTGAFDGVKSSNICFLVFMSIALFFLLLALSFFLSMLWLPKEDVVAVCYCGPAKTPAMGVPLSHAMFLGLTGSLESKIQIPLVIYQGLQIVAGSLLATLFKRWASVKKEEIIEMKVGAGKEEVKVDGTNEGGGSNDGKTEEKQENYLGNARLFAHEAR